MAEQLEGYIFGTSFAEQERLLKQGERYEHAAQWMLDQIGIQPGWHAVDLGCGPLGILHLLSDRVGNAGEVVGLEREPHLLGMAQTIIAERHLPNVRLVEGDASATELRRQAFDVAHARLLLIVSLDPERVVAEMVALVRPGGIVALQEFDVVSILCEPPHPAWAPLMDAYHRVFRTRGLSGYVGRRVPGLLRAAGLVDVRVHVHTHVSVPGDVDHLLLLQVIEDIRDQVITQGVLTPEQLTALVESLQTHLNQPETMVVHPLLFQVWGRKPQGDAS